MMMIVCLSIIPQFPQDLSQEQEEQLEHQQHQQEKCEGEWKNLQLRKINQALGKCRIKFQRRLKKSPVRYFKRTYLQLREYKTLKTKIATALLKIKFKKADLSYHKMDINYNPQIFLRLKLNQCLEVIALGLILE